MNSRVVGTPRPVPRLVAPILAGTAVIALGLPLFVIAGWPLKGWLLAAVLWMGSHALGVGLQRVRLGANSLASSGAVAFGMMFRAIAVMIVVFAVAATDARAGLAAGLLYALAYTFELGLSLLAYYTSEPIA